MNRPIIDSSTQKAIDGLNDLKRDIYMQSRILPEDYFPSHGRTSLSKLKSQSNPSNNPFSKLKLHALLFCNIFATMINLLEHTRRHDITFCRNGRIFISAKVARILSLDPGDSINIAYDGDGEFLLFAVRHTNIIGRHIARCFPTKKGGNNLSANSTQLCRSFLQFANVHTDRASFLVGDAFKRDHTLYLPIIIKRPL